MVTGYGFRVPSLVRLGSGSTFSRNAMGPRLSHFICCDAIDSSSHDRSRIRGSPLGVAFALSRRMAGWKRFEEIAAWQHSYRVKLRVYTLLERPKVKRDLKLTTQLRESARSAPSNIAEGFGRFHAVTGLIRHLERTNGPNRT